MEIQLRELIDQIKKDGVEAAETEAEAIINDAKAQAENIIAEAKAQADKMIADAKAENERMQKLSETAIAQAGRNMLISFRESVTKELGALLGEETEKIYSADGLKALITKAVEAWIEKPDTESIELLLNGDDLKALEQELLCAFKERAKGGITLKSSEGFDGGFRIGVNANGAFYDYSSQAVVEMLSAYLDPKLTKLLKEAE